MPSAVKRRPSMRSASVALGVKDPDRVWSALGHYRIPEQDRDDIAHDILLAALEGRRKPGAEIENPERWFNGIILHHVQRWRRRRGMELTQSELDPVGRSNVHNVEPEDTAGEKEAFDKTKNPEEHAMSEERRRLLYQFLDELPPNQLHVVVAHHLEHLPFEDIAAALGKSYSTVYDYYRAGMRKLRAAVERWKAKQRDAGALPVALPLDSLFHAARATPERPTAEDVERILRRVRETIGDGGPGSSAPSSGARPTQLPRSLNVTLTLPVMAYFLVGPYGAAERIAPAPLDSAPTVVAEAEAPAATAGDTQGPEAQISPASVAVVPVAANTAAASTARLIAAGAPRAERALNHDAFMADQNAFDIARSAYFRGDMPAATAGLSAHAQNFPRSPNALEREQLWIESLVKLGRATEACRRAEQFRRAYPRIPLPAAVGTLCR